MWTYINRQFSKTAYHLLLLRFHNSWTKLLIDTGHETDFCFLGDDSRGYKRFLVLLLLFLRFQFIFSTLYIVEKNKYPGEAKHKKIGNNINWFSSRFVCELVLHDGKHLSSIT